MKAPKMTRIHGLLVRGHVLVVHEPLESLYQRNPKLTPPDKPMIHRTIAS